MVQSFGGILQGHKLSMVFYRDRDLLMLHNQFSLIDIHIVRVYDVITKGPL